MMQPVRSWLWVRHQSAVLCRRALEGMVYGVANNPEKQNDAEKQGP